MIKRALPPLGSRTWKPEEEEYLKGKWGQVSVGAIAEKLNRTPNSITVHAQRLGLGPVLLGGDYITLCQIFKTFTGSRSNGAYSYKMKSWVEERGLPVHTRKVRNNSFRVVYIEEFWKWAEKNRSFLDFSKMEPLSLGKEPAWVEEQRRKDSNAHSLQRKDPWTQEEDSRLKMLLKQQKYGYAELAKMLNRSEGAIQRRCSDLGLKERPVKADNHSPSSAWTDENYRTLAEGIKRGDSYSTIAELIGKSEKAVRGKVYNTYFTESADKVRAFMGSGSWGEGAPDPTVKQALYLSGRKTDTREQLERLYSVLLYRTLELKKTDYDNYFQRAVCEHWDELHSLCTAGGKDCDDCEHFQRIRPQYCVRCGGTFYERKENNICARCRAARKKSYKKKMAVLARRKQSKR